MTTNPSLPYPSALLSPICPDVAVSPMLVRDLLLHLRGSACLYALAGKPGAADHLTSLAEELEKAVRASVLDQVREAERYLEQEQRR